MKLGIIQTQIKIYQGFNSALARLDVISTYRFRGKEKQKNNKRNTQSNPLDHTKKVKKGRRGNHQRRRPKCPDTVNFKLLPFRNNITSWC